MNSYEKYKHFSVPNEIFQLDIENDVLIDLIKLLSFSKSKVPIKYISENLNISRVNVTTLNAQALLTVSEDNGEVVIDLSPLYDKLFAHNDSVGIKQQTFISTAALDRISFLLERKVKSLEVDKINSWLNMGYTTEEIEIAVHKSAINNVDNFSYIETVLFNNSNNTQQTKKNNVTRNIDLY